MARFASLIRGGYYRLSDANTDAVATLIRAATHDSYGSDYYKLRPYTLLDPFCGEGIALAALAKAWNAEAYGVELHPGRNETARERIGKDRVLLGPAEGLTSSGFDIVYANPPYDNLVEVDLTILAATHVRPDGLLVTALPEKATGKVLEALSGDFEVLFAQ